LATLTLNQYESVLIQSNNANWVIIGSTVRKYGNLVAGNYAQIGTTGRLSYVGSARKQWTKYTANTVTLVN
jgi:hypothetical protein